MVDNRAASNLKRLAKFVLFKEDDPKHRVLDIQPHHLAFIFAPTMGGSVMLVTLGYLYFGALGGLLTYLGLCLLILQVPHFIGDW